MKPPVERGSNTNCAARSHRLVLWFSHLSPLGALCMLGLVACGTVPNPNGPFFGDAVSLADGVALIGAPHGTDGQTPGLAYVFGRTSDGWTRTTELSAEGGAAGNEFGAAVALSGTTALVGAWGTDGHAPVEGRGYVFERGPSGWRQVAVLVHPNPRERDLLGISVALDGDTAVLGASGECLPGEKANPTGNRPGAVYVWSRNGTDWRYQTRITPDPVPPKPNEPPRKYPPWDRFGDRVALHGDLLAVLAEDPSTRIERVYVFRRAQGAWRQEAVLQDPRFRYDMGLAVSGDTLVVSSDGVLVVYTRTGGEWRVQARFEPRDSDGDRGFVSGGTVALDGNRLVAGDGTHADGKGAAYVFDRVGTEWKQTAMLTAGDTRARSERRGTAGDALGIAVGVRGQQIVLGASYHDLDIPNAGAAYVFELRGSKWAQTSKLVVRPER